MAELFYSKVYWPSKEQKEKYEALAKSLLNEKNTSESFRSIIIFYCDYISRTKGGSDEQTDTQS